MTKTDSSSNASIISLIQKGSLSIWVVAAGFTILALAVGVTLLRFREQCPLPSNCSEQNSQVATSSYHHDKDITPPSQAIQSNKTPTTTLLPTADDLTPSPTQPIVLNESCLTPSSTWSKQSVSGNDAISVTESSSPDESGGEQPGARCPKSLPDVAQGDPVSHSGCK